MNLNNWLVTCDILKEIKKVMTNNNLNDKKEIFAMISLPDYFFTVLKLYGFQCIGNCVQFPRSQVLCIHTPAENTSSNNISSYSLSYQAC